MALDDRSNDLSWDIIRYRALRQKVLETCRQAAVESALQRLDLAGISQEFLPSARDYTKQNAIQWREDPEAAAEIETRLASNGTDTESIYLQAQNRRVVLLREISGRRSQFGQSRRSGRTPVASVLPR
jgi:hypothetical protein